jgi:Flp pilus assembly protein TadD
MGSARHVLAVAVCAVAIAACGGATKTVTVDAGLHTRTSLRPLVSSRTARANASRYAVLVGAGIDLLNKNNPGAAEQLFTQATAKEPDSPVAYFDLGLAWERLGKLLSARRAYRQAILRGPDYVPALYNLALIAQPVVAARLYQRLAVLRPQSAPVQLGLGLSLISQHGVSSAAIRALRRAVALQPSLVDQIPLRIRTRLGLR